MKRILNYVLTGLACCVLLNACGAEEEPLQKDAMDQLVEPVKTQVTPVDIASEIRMNREKWRAHQIGEYQIELQKICYCLPEAVRMMVFEVDENDISSARYADSGEDVNPKYYGDLSTVESVFAFAEAALEKNPADLSIAYDDKYGYIKELAVDFRRNIADDEISIIASNMRPQ